ncbi:MAG: ComF family protein [Gemmataceae bacterium]|nr:ComF family protein [Gemmataceae bacterium]
MVDALVTAIHELGKGLLHLLYPPVCWVCRQLSDDLNQGVCGACKKDLTTDPKPTCPRCASTVGPFVDLSQGCTMCRDADFVFDRAFRLGPYDGLLRETILRLKRPDGAELAEVVADLAAAHLRPRLAMEQISLVVPVPLHWRRRWQRGFNQTEGLAAALARALSCRYAPRLLRRIRDTAQQTRLTPAQRRDNVKGAFCLIEPAEATGATVLLVDDVMTTGATLNECARCLRRAKPARIIVCALAHGR